MPNITLSISDETRQKMKQHPEVRWSNAIRTMIEKKLHDFEVAERLVGKSGLTKKDIELLSSKANKSMAKHAKRLLNEGNS